MYTLAVFIFYTLFGSFTFVQLTMQWHVLDGAHKHLKKTTMLRVWVSLFKTGKAAS